MKKTTFILAVLMVLSTVCLSSCQKETAYETYISAYNKTNALTDYDMVISGEIEFQLTDTYTALFNLNKKRTSDNEGNPMVGINITYSLSGEEETAGMVYAKGWVYNKGKKIKKQITYDEAKESLGDIEIAALSENNFKNVEFTNENGKKTATLIVSADSSKNLVFNLSSIILSDFEENIEFLSVGDIELTLCINENGYIDEYDTVFTVNSNLDLGIGMKIEVPIDYKLKITYNDIGELVSVSVPEDADDYTDITSKTDLYGDTSTEQSRTEYILPPNISLALFGRTPENYFETYYSYYDWLGDFRDHAEIDKDGNLVLRLTEDQKEGLLRFYGDSVSGAKKMGIEISEDYTIVTFNFNEDEMQEKLENFPILMFNDMAIRQLFSDKDPATIKIECIVKDKETGNILYNASWPQEAISLSFEDIELAFKEEQSGNESTD